MKKLLRQCLFFFLVFYLTSVSYAEDAFSIRNGINFNMNPEEIKGVEKENGNEPFSEGDDFIYYKDINIAGNDHGGIHYGFKEGKLYEIEYKWGITSASYKTIEGITSEQKTKTFSEVKKIYDSLLETLSKKYQQIPSTEKAGAFSIVDFPSASYTPFSKISTDQYFYNYYDNITEMYGCKQFLTGDGNDYVVILIDCYYWESYSFTTLLPATNLQICTKVIYTYISQDEMNQVIEKAEEAEKKKNNDL